jgi:F-type H+-transporting ATPase subunit epsilon
MGNVHLEIITPEKVLVSQEVDSVITPGTFGEFGVLEDHITFLSGIVPGELHYTYQGTTKYFAVSSGFAEVFNNRVSVVVDAAENAHDIDVNRAKRAKERAEERLAKGAAAEEIDFARAEAALKRAIMRIKVAEKVI